MNACKHQGRSSGMSLRSAGVAGAALAVAMHLAPVRIHAQPLPAKDETASPIETIIVSVEKRGAAENAQTVPIALTAVNGMELEERHARDLQDLSLAAPNVTLADAGTVPGFANFTIRGLGTNTTIPSMEPAVGVFVDGIYQGVSAGVVLDLFDIEDIEILRGPQGLLFGRNTTGGAILINTRRPGDEFMVRGRFNYESGSQTTGAVSIEGPIGDQLRAKIVGYYSNDDGWFTNQVDGSNFGASRTGFVRPTIVWSPSAAFDTTIIYERGWSWATAQWRRIPLTIKASTSQSTIRAMSISIGRR